MLINAKNRIAIPFIGALLLIFTACDPVKQGTGDLITETRKVTDFHAIQLSCNGRVEVRQDSVFKVEVRCEESIIAFLETIEDNGVLKIHFDRTVFDVDDLLIKVSAPSWDGFDVSGSGDVIVLDDITGKELDLEVSGSGSIDISDLDFDNIQSSISGSGQLIVKGTADDLQCSVSGSGDYNGFDCSVKTAKVSVSGSGDVSIKVSDTLEASVSGAGDVLYKGDPTVTKNISGSGSVRKMN